ncbi:HNH endonuclease protein [Phage DSL-LC06]|nr:HNH endonuclease protein [Phage DSL-LC06]
MKSQYTQMRKLYPMEWRRWHRMIYKCRTNEKYYVDISVDPDWQGPQGFINFLDDMGPCQPGEVLDRIDKFADYSKSNCQWTNKTDSQNHLRFHQQVERGQYLKLALANGIKRSTYYGRIRIRGWHPHDAATLPPSQQRYRSRIL